MVAANITLNRDSSYIACVSTFNVYLDSKKVAEIGQNGCKTFAVEPGKRRIEVRDLATNAPMAKPIEIEIKSGETCALNVVCMAKASTYLFPVLALFSKKRREYYFVQFEIQTSGRE
ncbi:MAG: hypothetical protein IJE97_05785 [Thermoguttaceae bacterium]|nr:hypothetical protein [Thermoguttaceae bacterium]